MSEEIKNGLDILDWIKPLISLGVGAFGGWLTAWATMIKYKEKVDSIIYWKTEVCTKMDKLRSDVDRILEFKESTQKFIDNEIFKAKSPLQLTEIGKKLVEGSGFDKIFDKEKDVLVTLLEAKLPLTKYDVQEKARGLMDELTNYAAFQPIKTYAFNTGNDFGQILRAGSILLRDYYFSLHPEIKE